MLYRKINMTKIDIEPRNIGYLDNLRVIATFGVILIHISSSTNYYYSDYLSSIELFISTMIFCICRWCVPVFVMITGVLFLDAEKEISLRKLLGKYVLRIILAIILFGVPFNLMELVFETKSFNIGHIGLAISNIVQGKSWDHMWYLYMIAGLYLCIPIIRIFAINASEYVVKYTLYLLFIFTCFIPTLEGIMPYKMGISIPINSSFVFYLLLGYYIHYYKLYVNSKYLVMVLIICISLLVIMPLTTSYVSIFEGVPKALLEYNSPIIVMTTFSVFCFLTKRKFRNKVMVKLTPLCFGVYLIHPLFINLLQKYFNFTPENYSFDSVIIVTTLVTVISSFGVCYLLRKVDLLRKYVL